MPDPAPRPLIVRLGWLALIWSASVACLGLVAWLIRQVMRSVGMGT